MEYLVANYELELETPVLLKVADDIEPQYEASINGFLVTLKMTTDRMSASKRKNEKNWRVPYTKFLIKVSRKDIAPPKVIPDEKGTRDYTIQCEYFKGRRLEFGEIAVETVNRVIKYFKFRLWQPHLMEVDIRTHFAMNPRWTDETGEEIGKFGGYLFAEGIPAEAMENFSSVPLESKHNSSLSRYLNNPKPPSLKEEVLYDAQSAIYLGNYRRAVLELALSVEISVKQIVFGKNNHQGIAFEYLEDKGKINIRVLELIDGVSLQVFGKSFRTEFPSDYKEIDYLFRCRNKVAHRGEIIYRDDAGKEHSVDKEKLEAWWASICMLSKWLNEAKKKSPNNGG